VGVRLVGKVGDDLFGRSILDCFRAQDESLARAMTVVEGQTTSYSIVVNPPGVDRSFVHCPGANDTFSAADVPAAALAGAKLVHFGYLPIMKRMLADDAAELVRLFSAARASGLATSMDLTQPDPNSEAGRLDWSKVFERVLPLTDIFLPSIDELLLMLDRARFDALAGGEPHEKVIDAALLRSLSERLLGWGAGVVVIKLGENGLYLRTASRSGLDRLARALGLDVAEWADQSLLAPCFRASQVASTNGSGDCTIAGFLAALLRREGPGEAARSAVAVGACSVEAPDATGGVPRWETVVERLSRPWDRLPVRLPVPQGKSDSLGNYVLS
jgi:sugar/nucleoside kinase (ribokinase family)